MKIFKSKVMRLTMILFILVGLVLSAVVFSMGMEPLKSDKMASKYQSIVFGRVRILHTIKDFSPWGTGCTFLIYDFHSKKKLKDVSFYKRANGRLESASIDGYEIPFNAQAEEGDYLFGYSIFEFDQLFLDKIGIKKSGAEHFYIDKLYGRILKSCSISGDSLVYLGVIEIKFNKIFITKDEQIDTKTEVSISFSDFDTDVAAFQKSYPKLYEQYKDNIVKTVTWKDFQLDDESEEED